MSVITTLGVVLLVGGFFVYLGSNPETSMLFHLLVELFAVTIAIAIFMIAWNSRRRAETGYLVFLGIAYFFVAAIDLAHAVSHPEIGLVPSLNTSLEPQLWLAARYLQAGALLIAPAYLTKRVNAGAVFWGYAAASATLLALIVTGTIPVALGLGVDPRLFRVANEILIVATMAVGLVLLLRKRDSIEPSVVRLMAGSIGLSMIAELAFVAYTDPFSTGDMLAHLLRTLAYYLLYLALIKASIERPAETFFRELTKTADALRDSEERYRSTFEQATLGVAHVSLDGRWLLVNDTMSEIAGYSQADLKRMSLRDLTYPDDRATEQRLIEKLVSGEMDDYRLEKRLIRKDGSLVWVNSSTARLGSGEDQEGYLISIYEDITERKTLETAKARSREMSEALNAIDRTVLASLDTDIILQRVIENASGVLRADASAVLDGAGHGAIVRRVHRMNPSLVGTAVPTNPSGPSALALETGQPVWIPRAEMAIDTTSGWLEEQGFRSMLAVPLLYRDDSIGSLAFMWRAQPHAFGEVELEFARKLSAIVSVAMENARLYAAEHGIAEALQASLIGTPQKTPGLDTAQAYYSATELTKIGGDFYDVFDVGPGKTAFVLGDVSGKGLEAAAITAMAKSTLRAFAYRDSDPGTVLAAANDVIAEQIDDSKFITAVFGVIDLDTGTATIGCAGHPSPIRCGNTTCSEDNVVRNLPLGVIEHAEFETYETHMRPGDILVLFSDGLIDARQGSDLLGEERVHAVLTEMSFDATPGAVVQKLLETAQEHSAGTPADDITILALRYLGVPDS